ncbi:phenylalanine--tRNA ligase subunit beta [Candidatus Saccharibacteria bacterium]|nr:phenylalanine--tRNA ligase subunit beta [Candidatus Saccharibacteria bacterium]
MLISLNELKSMVKIEISDNELFRLIGSRLVEIEHVEDLAPKYKKIYIVKVKSAEPIEGTHLHLCQIDAGKDLNAAIDPEHDGYIQVVCGAPNVKKGMFAVWIAPGAIVPATFGTSEEFEISARKLRGFMSFGMLAAADELALGSDHGGILSINPEHMLIDETGRARNIRPGDSFAMAFDLNDKIIEVENKSLTHRPDCFGLIGFAREVAGILDQPFSYVPTWVDINYDPRVATYRPLGDPDALKIHISDYSLCPRYEAYLFDIPGVSEHPENLLLDDIFLYKAGMRPVSPLVDLTNIIMLETGQPIHAFDYDKFVRISGGDRPEINVRLARKGEKLVLLDDKEIELVETDIVICSGDTPVALAGAFGGKSTAIDSSTRKIIVEIASFSLYNLRKTQMAHGIFSEAITRFTKGRPASDLSLAGEAVLKKFVYLGGELAGLATSTDPALIKNDRYLPNVVKITTPEINQLLGTNYPTDLIVRTLENVEFKIDELEAGVLEITVPTWRSDIHQKVDIIEEVGRLLGFDNAPLNFALRPFVCPVVEPLFDLKSKLRNLLSDRLGANELLTYSFVSKNLQEKSRENPDDSYKIINSISPELECFRQELVPSLLDKIRENEKSGFKDFALYELNQVSRKSWGLNNENVPEMKTHLGLTTFGDFYRAKGILLELEKSLHTKFTLKPLNSATFLEPLHSAGIYLGDEKIGELGEIRASVLKNFKLESTISAIELSLEPLLKIKPAKSASIKLSKFPFVSRDLTFRVPKDTAFEKIEEGIKTILSQNKALTYKLELVSIFRKANDDKKNLSFHLEVANLEKTLDSKAISDIIEAIVNHQKTLGAEVV